VVKPFDAGEILLRIRNLLTTRALHVELDRHRQSLAETLRLHEDAAGRRRAELAAKRASVERALAPGALRMVFQPVFAVEGRRLLGVESLTRFDVAPSRPPDQWFHEAEEVGLSAELQLASIAAALTSLPDLPEPAFLAVNLSADILLAAPLGDALRGVDLSRIVLELTEHEPVRDYDQLHAALEPLRAAGARFAIDDAGAGYASFQHILRLRPDIIKLDLDLTRGIDHDPVRRALGAALVTFGAEIGALLVAEGVETREELDALAGLGFGGAQGYYLGRPAALADALSENANVDG
jgi:EAL domain-containing protein (putative c-di-GMP-specific phosphodiesterase class I)